MTRSGAFVGLLVGLGLFDLGGTDAFGTGLFSTDVFGTGRAYAHGPAPAVLEVLAANADGRPTLLRTSVGLAEARDDGTYGYLCPSLWGGNELARAVALADGRVVVIDAGALYVSDANRSVFERDEMLERAFAVRDVAAEGNTLFVLARERTLDGLGRSALFAYGESPSFLDETPDGLLAIEGTAFATAPSPSLCDADGCRRIDAEPVDRLVLRGADDDAFWLLATTDVRELWRVDRATLAVTPGPSGELVLGPVTIDGRPTAIVDGLVHRYEDGAWVAGEEVAWSAFDAVGGHAFVASLDGVFAVTDSLVTPRLVFRFAQLGPAREEHDALCALDWTHFGGEAGWLGTAPATDPEGARRQLDPSAGGCDVAASPSTAWLAALALFWTARRRAGARTGARSTTCCDPRSHPRNQARSHPRSQSRSHPRSRA